MLPSSTPASLRSSPFFWDERSMPTIRKFSSLPWNSLGVLISWFSLMLPPAGVMAPIIRANAAPKISAMTSSVMSRICHQRIFFFFLAPLPFLPPPSLPPFLPLPLPLRGGLSPSRGGLRPPPAAVLGASGSARRLRGFGASFSRRMPPAASTSYIGLLPLAVFRSICCTWARERGAACGCAALRCGWSYRRLAACWACSGGRFTVRRGRCT